MIDETKLTDAGLVTKCDQLYKVVYCHQHDTLKQGDVVRLDTPKNWKLLRLADNSHHELQDDTHMQYVILYPLDKCPCCGK